jgi:hypothetical protein
MQAGRISPQIALSIDRPNSCVSESNYKIAPRLLLHRGDLGADALEQTETPNVHERYYPRQPEASILEQRPIFRVRSFHAHQVN